MNSCVNGDVVKCLDSIAHNVDVNCQFQLPYSFFCANSNEILEILTFSSDDKELKVYCSPIHIAAAFGHCNVIELLLFNGADATAATTKCCDIDDKIEIASLTALDVAKYFEHNEIILSLSSWSDH